MDAAPLALATWGVELVDGAITVGGSALHPVVARELWLRLGQLLDAQERDEDGPAWARLEAHLDAAFRDATPCRGRSGRMRQAGLMVRESEGRVIVRLATFAVAVLRRHRRAWEGPVMAARPATTGWDARPTGATYRLELDQVPEPRAPLLLPPPTTRSAMPLPHLRAPVMPDHVRVAREQGGAAAAPILAQLETGPKTFTALREGLPDMPEDVLRARLAWLADLERVRRRGPAWMLVRARKQPEVGPTPPPAPARAALVPLTHPKTFEYRAMIRARGGRWDEAQKRWLVPPAQRPLLLARMSGAPDPETKPAKPTKRGGRASTPAPQAPLVPFRLCNNPKCATACRTTAPNCPSCKQLYP